MADLAASMQPGSWAELATSNISVFNQKGTDGNIIGYAADALWDPTTGKFIYIGNDHIDSNFSEALRFVIYDETSNTWQNMPPPPWSAPGVTDHGYFHHGINTATSTVYRRGGKESRTFYKYHIPSGTWSTAPANNLVDYQSCCGGVDYFPELGGLVLTQGGDVGGGRVMLFNESTQQWSMLARNISPLTGPTFTLGVYNPVQRVMVFGQNGYFYKLDSAGTVRQLAAPPVQFTDGTGIFGILTVDPVSGKYIYLTPSSRQLYTYDVSTDTWTTQNSTGKPSLAGSSIVASPINNYGVVMFVACYASSCHAYLYKHAAGTSSPIPAVPAPTISITANPTTINTGGASTLTWSAVNATSCSASGGWSGTTATSGTATTVSLSATTTFTLTCTGTGGSASQSATVTVTPLTTALPSSTNPVAWWKFDEGSGNSATDSSGTGNTATVVGSTWTSGALSSALDFNGTNSYVRGAGTGLDDLTRFTYTAWIYPRALSSNSSNAIISKGSGSQKRFVINNYNGSCTTGSTDGCVEIAVNCSVNSASAFSAPGTIALNTWQFVAVTYSSGASPKIYKNGSEATYLSQTACVGGEVSESGTNFFIGTWAGGTSDGWFNGMIDDVRVYNRVLSQSEIQDLYAQASTNVPSVPAGAPTLLLSASPTSVASGSASTLSWTASNATSCSASGGWSGTRAISGTASTGSLASNTTFSLSCTGTGGSISQSVTVALLSSTPSTPSAGGAVTSFSLTSSSTGTKPFTIGHAFKQGDIPAGQVPTSSDATDFQAAVKNRWQDGSVKFAILSGRAALTANTPKTIGVSAGSDPGGTPLTETQLSNTGITASIQFGSAGTVNLQNLIGVASTLSGGRMTPGRVRTWISGPKMSSWIYYSRIGSDSHLSAWFEVRLWSDGSVEVLPWVENSTLNVPSPAGKAPATVTFTLGGSQRYSGNLSFGHHTRAVLASGTTFSHWLGADPAVTPRHNTAYVQSTKLVPNYRAVTSSNSSVWSGVVQAYSPLSAANIPYSGMEGTGYGSWIGPIPEHDVVYLTSGGDPRGLATVIVNAYAAGGLDMHFRDETTNQPLRFSAYPNLVTAQGENITNTGSSSTGRYTPTPSGTYGGGWDVPHHPSMGYMAYLLLGRFYFLEETQFVATTSFLNNSDTNRQFGAGVLRTDAGALTTRGAAWAIRSLVQAATISPDGDSLASEFLNSWAANIDYYHGLYVAQPNNPQGWTSPYGNYNAGDPFFNATWMEDFLTFSIGYGVELDLGISPTHKSKLDALFAWKARSIVGRLGGTGPTEFYFADAAQYVFPVAPLNSSNWQTGAGPWYGNFGEAYAAVKSRCPQCVGATDGNLRGGNFPEPTSYWGNLQPAIAYAVQLGATGALTGYNRMVGAGNWSSLATGFNDRPVWSVAPLTLVPAATPPVMPQAGVPQPPTNLSLQ